MADFFSYQMREEDLGVRLDRLLAEQLDLSRSQIQRLFSEEKISCESKILVPRAKVEPGKTIDIEIPEPISDEIQAEPIPLNVIFEDEDVIAINKEPGMVVHPGSGVREGTLVAALLHQCKGELSGIGGIERPGIVHRLDKDTSGLIIAAKNDKAHQHLARSFEKREVKKTYLAFAVGQLLPRAGGWRGEIGRHPVARQKMAVLPNRGRHAHTSFQSLKQWQAATLIECGLHTGRTHQIRVHAAHAGFPLVGDATYGKRAPDLAGAGVKRQLLHSYRLEIQHPNAREVLDLMAPVPEDFSEFELWLNQNSKILDSS
ncbi:MAG: RluA family pseudouridine synthase [Verrucomicrobiota bacterium]